MKGVYKIFTTTWRALLIGESKTKKNYLTHKIKVTNLKSLKKNALKESTHHHKPPKP